MEQAASSNNTDSPPQKLRKLGTACQTCHRRKIRCDGASSGLPCSNCASTKATCRPRERRRRAGKHISVADATVIPANQQNPQSSPLQLPSSEHDPDLDTPPSDETELAKQHLFDFINQDLHNNPIRERLQYIGTDISNLYHLVRQKASKANIYHYPCSHVNAPRTFKNTQQPPATPNLIPKDAFILPPRNVADILIRDYFDFVAPGLPIIEEAAFLAQYNDPGASPPYLLLQAICLVGAHVTKRYNNTSTLKAAFFRRTKALIDGRYEEDRMNTVQAAILLTFISDGADDVNANAWFWVGMATRAAIGLGMHRDVIPSNMPLNDKRTWRRLWWVLVQFDTLVSLGHGRPQTINLDDCDVPPLTVDDFEDSFHRLQVNFVIEHSKLCSLISGFVRNCFSIKSKPDTNTRRAVDTALAKWLVHLPEDMRLRLNPNSSNINFWPAMLHSTYNAVLIILHRLPPSGSSETGTEPVSGDSGICVHAAGAMVQIFEALRRQDLLRYCWCWSTSFLFTTVIQISTEMRSQSPILATNALEKFDSTLASIRDLAHHWLFATSILRLFEHSSERLQQCVLDITESTPPAPHDENSTSRLAGGTGVAMDITHPEMLQVQNQDNNQDMINFATMASYSNEPGNINIDNFDWLGGQERWAPMYHHDPLANVRLDDTWGDLGFFWKQ